MVIYQNDHLGTPQKLTAVNGAVVWSAKHSSFGEADVGPSSTITNNLRFPGQYFDQETELHYNHNRFYDPKSGRYLSPDPIGYIGGLNLFAYTENNPINSIDPLGLAWIRKNGKLVSVSDAEYQAHKAAYRERVRRGKEKRRQRYKNFYNSPEAQEFMHNVNERPSRKRDDTDSWNMIDAYKELHNGYTLRYSVANDCTTCVVSCFVQAAFDIPAGELYTQIGTRVLKKYALKAGMTLAGKLIPGAGWGLTAYSGYVFYTCTVENCIGNE